MRVIEDGHIFEFDNMDRKPDEDKILVANTVARTRSASESDIESRS